MIKLPLFSAIIFVASFHGTAQDSNKPLKTIAFGSCSNQNYKEQMWPEIANENADLFIFSGDIVYADTHDMSKLKKIYDQQKNHPDYQKLLKTTSVIGVWDDHDYGINDGGKYYTQKKASRDLLLDFLDVPEDNHIWSHEGAYNSYTFGNKGQQVKIILLDGRYFRDTLLMDTVSSARYLPNEQGDMLGEAQWHWLEQQLTDSQSDINIIVSGIQVISSEHGYEKWANFPLARKRLFDLIAKSRPKRTLIISGDRHIAEVSKIDLDGLDYPLYDITSSGLTHTWSDAGSEKNQYRISELVIQKNYGLISIDWSADEPGISVEIKGHDPEPYLSLPINLN